MKTFQLILAALALTGASAVAAECTAPSAPTLPDGASASMEEMLEGQKAVKAFQEANLAYMGCLDPQISAAAEAARAEDASDAVKETVRKLEAEYNAAVSQEEEVADRFNTAIREYKEANPG